MGRDGAGDGWLLLVCSSRVLLYANFMVYAACIPVVRDAWQMSAAEAGSISSGFMLGYAASLVLFSWLADRLGAKRVVALSAWASAACALLFGLFARSYPSALALYTLAALAQGGVYTPLIMLLADRYPPARRGRAVGWLIASTSVGYAFSLLLSGVAIAWGGYRAAFLLTGALPLGGALVLWAALRGTPNRVHPRTWGGSLLGGLRGNVAARRLVGGYVAHSWELLGMWAWMPAFLAASLALSGALTVAAAEVGAYLTAGLHAMGAAAAFSMGGLSDRLGRRAVLLGLAALSALLSCTIGWLIAWPVPVLVALGIVYAFAAIGDSPVLSTALTEVVEPGHLGAVLAVRSLLGFGAGAVAPLAFGVVLDLADASAAPALAWGLAFSVLGAGGLIAALAAFSLPRGAGRATAAADRPCAAGPEEG